MPKIEEIFAARTSIHGVAWVAESKQKWRRVFWIIVLLFCLIFLVYNTSNNVILYMQHPTEANIEILSKKPPFPTMTLCNNEKYFQQNLSTEQQVFLKLLTVVRTNMEIRENYGKNLEDVEGEYVTLFNTSYRNYINTNETFRLQMEQIFHDIMNIHLLRPVPYTVTELQRITNLAIAFFYQRELEYVGPGLVATRVGFEKGDSFNVDFKPVFNGWSWQYFLNVTQYQIMKEYEIWQSNMYTKCAYEPPVLGSAVFGGNSIHTFGVGKQLNISNCTWDEANMHNIYAMIRTNVYNFVREFVPYEDDFGDINYFWTMNLAYLRSTIEDIIPIVDFLKISLKEIVPPHLALTNEMFHAINAFSDYYIFKHLYPSYEKKLMKIINDPKFDSRTIIDNSKFPIDSSVLSCRVNGKFCQPDLFTYLSLDDGQCIQINRKNLISTDINKEQTVELIINAMNYRQSKIPKTPTGTIEAGFKLYLTPADIMPDHQMKYVLIHPEKLYSIQLSFRSIHNLDKDNWGECDEKIDVDRFSKMNNFKNYSRVGCIKECIWNEIVKNCSCITFNYVHLSESDIPICSKTEQIKCVESTIHHIDGNKCEHCRIECEISQYDWDVYSDMLLWEGNIQRLVTQEKNTCIYNFMKTDHFHVDEEPYCLDDEFFAYSIAKVRIVFSVSIADHRKQQRSIEIVTILSNFGGSMGLCMGMSIITAVELIDYLIMKCLWRREARRVRDKLDEEEMTEKKSYPY
ncbi:hypothetical protein SNEBB_007588 [Seison nebaliae]|nr:hypothetical protein SNEBB_007588 [Seison nebaliae]